MAGELSKAKPFTISKREAYRRIKVDRVAAGVGGQWIEAFEKNLANSVYRMWNRMSVGSYFPTPVRIQSHLNS